MGSILTWSTIILAIWGAVGPLVGVRYGQDLSKRNQRAQWVLDSKKQEFKEILKAMAEAFSSYVYFQSLPSGSDTVILHDAENKMFQAIESCLFIRERLKKQEIGEQFVKLLESMLKGRTYEEASVEYLRIRDEVIELTNDLL